MLRLLGAVGLVFVLSGCYSLQGSERVLGRDGRVTAEVDEKSVFYNDFNIAYSARISTGNTNSRAVDDMLSSGFVHIYNYCDYYFDRMAIQQRKSRVTRDAIAPISAVITGVIALQNFGDSSRREQDLLAGLGIATAASSSALDIYDEHMLFGAENIGAVELLTKAALATHSSAVGQKGAPSYDSAIRHLLDNQAICSPQHILTLTRAAIADGQVVAVNRGSGEDQEALRTDPDTRVEVKVDNSAGN